MLFEDLIESILSREGGLVDDPTDRGGKTNYGITQRTLAWWRKDPHADPATLTRAEAAEILEHQYIKSPKFDDVRINNRLRNFMVDFGVHSGPSLAIRHLQRILNVEVDGVLGPKTLGALQLQNQGDILTKMVVSRLKMIARLVQKHPAQIKFLCGWVNRVVGFLEE